MSVQIFDIRTDAVCYKKGVRSGDTLVSVNGNEIFDVLDYRFYAAEETLRLEFYTAGGKRKRVKLKNVGSPDEIGLEFETYLMDKQHSCKNKCIFCFIDQLPKGLRPSLYFKDDDARLSFLFGNYITLTNLTDRDVERIVKMHISPINASVHTMDPALRVAMMKNPKAGESLGYLNVFSDAGIKINAQLVLCPGINDGEALLFSLRKLGELKGIQSVAAVPVGLTCYREGLAPLRGFTAEEAAAVIDTVDSFNDRRISEGGERLAFASDEFYQLARRPFPDYGYYGDFPQLENGVGTSVNLEHEFMEALDELEPDDKPRGFTVVTGLAAEKLQRKLADAFTAKFPNAAVSVRGIENRFFGSLVTVAGLLTGKDVISHFKTTPPENGTLLFPSVMFKSRSEPIFLDDVSIGDIEKELGVRTVIVDCDARSLLDTMYALC